MKNKYLSLIIGALLVLLFVSSCATSRYLPPAVGNDAKHEFRGAWIQTIYQGEYSQMSVAEMKQSFIKKLDFLQDCGINALIFQVRPEADAFYKSRFEPWSRFYTGKQGLAPENDFDLMEFLIEECHQRAMEFHAWLNPYRAGTSGTDNLCDSHVYYKHPDWFVFYNKQLLFDPGMPQSRQHICNVVRDIVMRYDVDGIHMDDYFYPYPAPGLAFPDDESFARYGSEYSEAQRGDWRRENVNKLISELKRTILLVKPWVRLGISPFGIYRNQKSTPDGSGSKTNGLQNYDDLYADVLHWVKQGWVDYMMPQIYWEIGHAAADYATLVQWWNKHAYDRPLYIGQDVNRTMKVDQLAQKMRYTRGLSQVNGNCFWPANEILWNNGGIADSLKRNYHRYPALIPGYTHLSNRAPKEVKKLKTEWTADGFVLHWMSDHDILNPESARYYVVYKFAHGEPVDLNNPARIVTITPDPYYMLPYEKGTEKYRYVVTSVDRFNNESVKGKRKKVKL